VDEAVMADELHTRVAMLQETLEEHLQLEEAAQAAKAAAEQRLAQGEREWREHTEAIQREKQELQRELDTMARKNEEVCSRFSFLGRGLTAFCVGCTR
jgi:hypothetical protein